ncbi:hypothetical protein [Poseidonocella pacifica]|uniref:hypothetical protein n=1 Tax=Poseidonocella pacifica TaxID=871651 RepID=UPI001113E837|nr:hypothetical protein [Poseidonocella pacifica]
MIAFGGCIFSGLYENGNLVHATQTLAPDIVEHEVDVPIFYPTAYAADTFIPLIDLGQASNWSLIERRDEPIGAFLLFYWVYIFLGWIFAAIFGASVTGLVRK